MMTATAPIGRYETDRGLNGNGLLLAGGMVGCVIAGLIFAAPDIVPNLPKLGPITLYPVKPDPEPPKPIIEPQQPHQRRLPQPRPDQRPVSQDPVIKTAPQGEVPFTLPPSDPGPAGGTTVGEGSGGGTAIDPPIAPPVLIEPVADPRYRDDLQPPYPAEERREGNEGLVVVRVLVAPNGRVIAVERVSAASDAFFDATRRQALSKWRFKPGTRDGVPIERWRLMRVTFRLTDE